MGRVFLAMFVLLMFALALVGFHEALEWDNAVNLVWEKSVYKSFMSIYASGFCGGVVLMVIWFIIVYQWEKIIAKKQKKNSSKVVEKDIAEVMSRLQQMQKLLQLVEAYYGERSISKEEFDARVKELSKESKYSESV